MKTIRTERRDRLKSEMEAQARPQLPGHATAPLRSILATEATRPLRGGDMPLGHASLFGDSHMQKDMFTC